ncbi:MAG: FHA domain-containing protein [Sedimentisphaerales bacterium]|nr:FHA domain-containing protein [Sedimentisphaerales bacterium]
MRLIVKQGKRVINDFHCTQGPVYIGRHTQSQIFLPDAAVSRQHAVVFATSDGQWMIEDLESANQTHLNGQVVHQAQLKTGDLIRIAGFTIEVDLEKQGATTDQSIRFDDTLAGVRREPQVIRRSPDAEHAPDIRLAARRAANFIRATKAICEANGPEEVLDALLEVLCEQFDANRVWCMLRNDPAGPTTAKGGKSADGLPLALADIGLKEAVIRHALEKRDFLLLPHAPAHGGERVARSVMIAPVLGASGCFGLLYVDNHVDSEPYTPGDLDYLMLIAIHLAAALENF